MKTLILCICLQIAPWICSKNIDIKINQPEFSTVNFAGKINTIGVITDPNDDKKNILIFSLVIENLTNETIVFEKWKFSFRQNERQVGINNIPLPFISYAVGKELIPPHGKISRQYSVDITNSNASLDIISTGLRLLEPNEDRTLTR